MAERTSDVVIVGGGPAGMIAGLLFARAGIETTVLEKHTDFLRDFRGDTIHPSTLELFHELGSLDTLLARDHVKVPELHARVAGEMLGRRLQPSARGGATLDRPPALLDLLDDWPRLRRLPARIVGLGVRPEHVRSPEIGTGTDAPR